MSKKRVESLESTAVFQKYYNYMQSVIPTLVEAEKTVHEIKSSVQWTKSLNYFNVLYKRGQLEYRPTMENGYLIKPVKALRLEDIEDILTPEQLAEVKARLAKEG